MKTTNQAIDTVKANNSDFYLSCYAFAVLWVKNQFKPFTSVELKNAFYDAGNPKPREPRIFGAVIRELMKDGLILSNGYVKNPDPIAHSRPSGSWISREYDQYQKNKLQQLIDLAKWAK